MNIARIINSILTFPSPDGRVSAPALRKSWKSRADAEAELTVLIPELARLAKRDLTPEHFQANKLGIPRERTRDAFAVHQDRETQRAQFPTAEQLPVEEQLARHAEQRVREEQFAKLPLREQQAVRLRQQADEAAAKRLADAANAAARARPDVAAALNTARDAAIRSAFDADVSDREAEFAQHNLALLESTLNVPQWQKQHREWLAPIAERKNATLTDRRNQVASELAAKEAELRALQLPEAPKPGNGPFAWDRPPEPAESKSKNPLMRVFYDGRSAVVPKWAVDDNADDPAFLAGYAKQKGSHEDAVLQPGDLPSGSWS